MLCVQKRKAFTIVELLVVVAIIALLVGIMVPAVRGALDRAKDLAVKTQLASISTGLELFKSDAGDYPESLDTVAGKPGAQLLCDALLGVDLKGPFVNGQQKNPYIKQEGIDFFPYGPDLSNQTYVMQGKWGHAILYYRAAPGAMLATDAIDQIYDADDNANSIPAFSGLTDDPLADATGTYKSFYSYITNVQIGNPADLNAAAPFNAESFILISAGKDGIYGNEDDIANFDRKGVIPELSF